jgi:GGDEF domain-containing protein
VGIASHPKDAETIGTLLYAADRALYSMKDKRPRARQTVHASKTSSEVVNPEFSGNRG